MTIITQMLILLRTYYTTILFLLGKIFDSIDETFLKLEISQRKVVEDS